MSHESSHFPYLHGFSSDEQDRLLRQARHAEFSVFRNIDFSDRKHILEVGCGVGAQSEILLRRFPNLKITGIDSSDTQLKTLNNRVENGEIPSSRFEAIKTDAKDMEFSGESFDGAFLCWVLEHIPEPQKVLSEVKRVLKRGSTVYISEVMNSSFFLNPYSPSTWKYWVAFNDYQWAEAGDPFIGAKLGNLLQAAGFNNIQTNIVSWHYDNREPEKRRLVIEYWSELLLSAAPTLIKAGIVDEALVESVKKELKTVSKDPSAVFQYSFMQARAEV